MECFICVSNGNGKNTHKKSIKLSAANHLFIGLTYVYIFYRCKITAFFSIDQIKKYVIKHVFAQKCIFLIKSYGSMEKKV